MLFEGLGGVQLRTRQVVANPDAKPKQKKSKDMDSLSAGFKFIKEYGPRANSANQFVEWTEYHINNDESPIHGWDRGLVKESLRNYAAGEAVAPSITLYPLTLADFKEWVIKEIAIPCIKSSKEKGIFLHGLSGIGKTPLATAMCLALSGYNLVEAERDDLVPAFRSAQHLDNFRAEPGSPLKPSLFDDGNLNTTAPADIKAYLDAAENVIIWARWGGCKFSANQARVLCNNPIDRAADKDDIPFFHQTVPHKDFVELTKVAYNQHMNEEDHFAILKRCTYIVFGPHHLYVREASAKPDNVKIMRYPDVPANVNPDLIRESAKEKFGLFKAGDRSLPPDYSENFQWSITLVRKVLQGETIDEFHPRTTTSMPPLHTAGPSSSSHMMPPSALVAVKKEIRNFKRTLSKAKLGEPIDLSSPQKKQEKDEDVDPAASSMHADVDVPEALASQVSVPGMLAQELEALMDDITPDADDSD